MDRKDENNKAHCMDFMAGSQGNHGVGKGGDGDYCFNEKELRNWRLMYGASFILWFFIGRDLIEHRFGVIVFIISFGVPYFSMYKFIYKRIYFKKIYGVKWSEKAEDIILGENKNK